MTIQYTPRVFFLGRPRSIAVREPATLGDVTLSAGIVLTGDYRKMWRLVAAGVIMAGGSGSLSYARQFDVKPGLWEVSTSVTSTAPGGNGLGSRAKLTGQKRTLCVTNLDLETGNLLDHISGCSQKVKSSTDKLTVHLRCPAPYGEKSQRVSEFERIDSENFKGSIRMLGEGGMEQIVTGSWIRAACNK